MLPCNARKALSPVVASVILLGVVIAVSLVTVAWISGLSTSFMQIEELHATNHQWGPNVSYVDVTLHNTGTQSVRLSSVSVNSQLASVTYVVGSSQIGDGESAVLRISDTFVPEAVYQFAFQTAKGNKFFYIATAELVSSIFRMEWGTVTANDTFKTVTLQQIYSSPIVVCSPVYDSGLPRTVRLNGVSPNSFKIRVQNPSNATLPETTVHYLVVEEGEWTTPFKIEAKKYQTSTVGQNNDWAYDLRSYGQNYSGNIIVLHQVMSYNDPAWIATYVSKANSRTAPPSSGDSSFRIALNGAEAEDIGYIIIQEGYDVLNGIKWDAKQTADTIQGLLNSPPYKTSFGQTFSEPPNVVLAFQQEMDGGNGGWALLYSTSSTQVGLACDEDQVNDSERSHTTETCGFIAFENAGSYTQ
jgi:hypothetical protein